jgi:hypothetical protein
MTFYNRDIRPGMVFAFHYDNSRLTAVNTFIVLSVEQNMLGGITFRYISVDDSVCSFVRTVNVAVNGNFFSGHGWWRLA